MQISVIGLGKLGAPLVAVLADKGHTVTGADLNEQFVVAINERRAPVDEPGLQDCINRAGDRLRATTDVGQATLESDVTFIIVPTPSTAGGVFTNKYVLAAVEEIGRALQRKTGYHLVVVTSTVMPGSTGGEIRETLERSSKRTLGDTLGLCYNPEFIALGSVIANTLRPDFVLIGESDARAGDLLEAIHHSMCENAPPVRRMNFVNAELCKISVNTFVTTKISYANMLAEICERLPGADVDVVSAAIGADSRIGTKYLRGATGYGGPCFPRDNVAFTALAQQVGAPADIAVATDRINRHQIERLSGIVMRQAAKPARIGILGLSYKPDTGVIEESQGVMLAKALLDAGYAVIAHDPMAGPAVAAVLPTVTVADSGEACVAVADVVVLVTAWAEYRSLPVAAFARADGARIAVVDCWRLLDGERYGAVADLVYPGYGASGAAASGLAQALAG